MLGHDSYYASLPRRRMGAGMLFTDHVDRVLIVQPTYKPTWEVPGGLVEEGENPPEAAVREVREELGIGVECGPLLVIAHRVQSLPRGDSTMLIYDGGVIEDPSVIRLPEAELASFRFVDADELSQSTTPTLAERMQAALRARKEGRVIELIHASSPAEGTQ